MSTLRTDTLQTTNSSFSIDVEDISSAAGLGNVIDPSLGAAIVGRGQQVVTSFAGIRALNKTSPSKYAVINSPKFFSFYYLDVADTTTVESVPTVLVATDGGRWKLNHNGVITAEQCGLVGDGVTVNTSATLNAVNVAVTNANACLLFGRATYICESINLIANQFWRGYSQWVSILKAKDGLNAPFVTSNFAANTHNVKLVGLQLDGNRTNNTSGALLSLKGAKQELRQLTLINAAGTGLVTDFDLVDAERVYGFESVYEDILIDTSFGHGWLYSGPTDSSLNNVTIIDAGTSADNTFYGMFATRNFRANNLHFWNRSFVTNTPAGQMQIEASAAGCSFTNSHFEGGHTPLRVFSNGNTFQACSYYAPRGAYCIENYGTGNDFGGTMAIGSYPLNPDYKGILLSGAANTINLVDDGCNNGAVDFTGDTGNNFVRITGFHGSGTLVVGSPHPTDDVNINITGAGGGTLRQEQPISFTNFVTSVTSETGTLSSASVSFRYQLRGRLCFYEATISIANNGTGATAIRVPLPFTCAAFGYNGIGEESIGGKTLRGKIAAGTNILRIVDYANAYPAASGAVLVVNGEFEVA